MKCPCCQALERNRVRYCRSCGHSYTSEDLLKLRQIEFLLKETAGWEGVALYRNLYLEKLEVLKRRILPPPVEKPVATAVIETEPTTESIAASVAVPVQAPTPEAPPASKPTSVKAIKRTAHPKEKVPFDQWLLSERNIKIALYSGAVLLVLAGIIFIGVNWVRFSGRLKFSITSLITLLTYFSGYQLFKRPTLKLGGNALFGIAGGFFALNFGVLQIYLLGPQGMQNDVMWLITSPICLGVYMFTAFWTKSDLFTYLSIAAVGSTLTAALVVASAPTSVFILAFSLLAVCMLGLAVWLKKSTVSAFTVTPLFWASNILIPAVLIIAGWSWVDQTGCTNCYNGSPFLSIASIVVGGLFYIFTDLNTTRKEPRWAVPVIFTAALAFTMIELDFSDTSMGIGLMLQALVYLWIGYGLDRKSSQTNRNVSFYIMTFLIAIYLTYSTFTLSDDMTTLVIVLFGDVLLLGCTSFIKRSLLWLYGAVWLMVLPVYLLTDMLIPKVYNQGLVMFGLAVLYLGSGYLVGQKNIKWSGPFLTSTAILSAITVAMTLENLLIASLVLVAWAVIYPLTAVWLKWSWLNFPGLVTANIAIATLNFEFVPNPQIDYFITGSYLGFGVLLWLVGRWLSQIKERDWSWPLYTVGAFNIFGAYFASLWFGEWLAISVSVVLATLFLNYASMQPSKILEKILVPLLPYLGVGTLFIGHFYLIEVFSLDGIWPVITAGTCAIFALFSWLIRDRKLAKVYELPFRLGGLVLMIIPLAGWLDLFMEIDPWVSAITYTICGVVYLVDAGLRRVQLTAFPGTGVVFASHFFILEALGGKAWDYWPITAAILCALFAAISWLLLGSKLENVFGTSFRLGGLGLMLVPMLSAVIIGESWVTALIFVICAAVYFMDAGLRRLQLMAYLGIIVVFIAHFTIRDALWPAGKEYWYLAAAGMCISFVIASWPMKGRKLERVYHFPFRIGGLVLMLVPLAGVFVDALFSNNYILYALTFGIAGAMYLGDAVFHDMPALGYLGILNYVTVIWAVLIEYEVNELQAFVIPFGLTLLGIGWYERVRYKGRFYRLFTLAGCFLLLGTAFYQSLPRDAWGYALLVGIESIISIIWGIRTQSRGYVQIGGIALIANSLVQFIPSFLEWSRWMQIGLTGSILLGLGLLALFRREKLLKTREQITEEWRSWKP